MDDYTQNWVLAKKGKQSSHLERYTAAKNWKFGRISDILTPKESNIMNEIF